MQGISEAVVLCGGLGTRLRKIVKDVPKPMAPVGDKPFLAFVLEYLKKQNIKRVILAVSYKYEVIQQYFGDEFLGMEIVYSIEKIPLGTGGAIKQALEFASRDCYVLNGDTFFEIPLEEMKLGKSKICIALKRMYDFDRYGAVEIDKNGFAESFEEKKFIKEGYINGGTYLVAKDIFDKFVLEDKFSFEKFLQENYKTLRIKTKVFDHYFIDIGIPEDYERFVNSRF
ncbi:D-glycero-D-manno-heptose 1-phosphate guanosyltransferase [Helicobacter pullorum]|uniref:D-glycero-D-manno-heptose 1-phosphate guanosyltransferase n=1 Tax=Helicobacter pullorum TaxID=35818 RepID=UPI0008169E91|nr:nucleotidyltransferase family protein [Helicobacter pullorum]OCR07231.1 D-glycero-D-manno-heptose 1-phosphate guanosyltransferase [Helicobacter pullorum]